MAITLNDLTVNIRHLDQATLLDDWVWLIGTNRFPILVTVLGDAFLQDTEKGGISLLMTGPGELIEICDDLEVFQSYLKDPEFVEEHFVPSILIKLREDGQELTSGQLYGFKTPPFLGGKYAIDNHEPTDISVHFSVLGQLCCQVNQPD